MLIGLLVRRLVGKIFDHVGCKWITYTFISVFFREEDRVLCRVLCIEDDAETRVLIKKGLEAAGMTVDAVWAGDKGVEAAIKGRFDCILLDIMMAGVDGFQVLKTLKTQLATQNIKVIMVTARDDDESRQRALNDGADAYVVKPFKLEELVTLIQTIVGK